MGWTDGELVAGMAVAVIVGEGTVNDEGGSDGEDMVDQVWEMRLIEGMEGDKDAKKT